MRETTRIELRKSEVAERLAELAAVDDLDNDRADEVRALTAEAATLEVRWRAATTSERIQDASAGPPPVDDDRQLVELRDRVSLVNYANAALADTSPTGAEAEYAAARGLPANRIPIDLLETRATDTADISLATGGQAPRDVSSTAWRPVLPRVFETPVTQMLGITTETVAQGQPVYPVITAGSTPTQIAEGTDDGTVDDAAFTITSLEPRRLTSTMELTGELALLVPGIENVLRRDMGQAFANQMEEQVLVGDGTAPNVSGITHGLTASTNPSAVTDWQSFSMLAASQIDGQWANSPQDVRLVLPVGIVRYGLGLWQTTTTDMNGFQALTANSGAVMGSAHLPANKNIGGSDVASKTADCLAVRANGRPWAYRAIWDGFSILRDPYTKATSGVTRLVGVAYWNFDVVRADAVARVPVRFAT